MNHARHLRSLVLMATSITSLVEKHVSFDSPVRRRAESIREYITRNNLNGAWEGREPEKFETHSGSVVREALEAAVNGLEWYRSNYPEHVNESDSEADELFARAFGVLDLHNPKSLTVEEANLVEEFMQGQAPEFRTNVRNWLTRATENVGDSWFEEWYSGYSPGPVGDKQRARDAYAAGMADGIPKDQHHKAWLAVHETLDEVCPGWAITSSGGGSGIDLAVKAIRGLASAKLDQARMTSGEGTNPNPATLPLTKTEYAALEGLVKTAKWAYHVADDSEDDGAAHHIKVLREDMNNLSEALNMLDALPDDQPGYTMSGPGRARWALRRVLGTQSIEGSSSAKTGDETLEFHSLPTGWVIEHRTDAYVARSLDGMRHCARMKTRQAAVTAAWSAFATELQSKYLRLRNHPMQPVVMVENVARFKSNRIVDHLFQMCWNAPESSPYHYSPNRIAIDAANGKYTEREQEQFAQLIGYSVSGFGSLSYAHAETVADADKLVEALVSAPKRGERSD